MTIALATRGYLTPYLNIQVVQGEGPSITGSEELKPVITGSQPEEKPGPSIVGSEELP